MSIHQPEEQRGCLIVLEHSVAIYSKGIMRHSQESQADNGQESPDVIDRLENLHLG